MTYPITFLLCIIILLNILVAAKEAFKNETGGIFTSNRLNFETLLKSDSLISMVDKAWSYAFKKLEMGKNLDTLGNGNRIIMTPIDYLEYASKFTYKQLDPGYFCLFVAPSKINYMQENFQIARMRFGYFDRCEQQFINTIAYGYRQRPGAVIPISFDKLADIKSLWNEIDILVCYFIPHSPYVNFIETQELAMLNISDIAIPRLKLTNPYLFKRMIPKSNVFTIRNKIYTSSDTITVIGLSLYLVYLKNFTEPFITRLKRYEAPFEEENYRCIGDPFSVTKAQCLSDYNSLGELKENPTIWDRPCKTNEECPYYKANKNYENTFGKCLPDGSCEMPVGVSRVGYRQHDSNGIYKPFCYQCEDPWDVTCCEKQKQPDYVFVNDTSLREKNKLPIYIPLPK